MQSNALPVYTDIFTAVEQIIWHNIIQLCDFHNQMCVTQLSHQQVAPVLIVVVSVLDGCQGHVTWLMWRQGWWMIVIIFALHPIVNRIIVKTWVIKHIPKCLYSDTLCHKIAQNSEGFKADESISNTVIDKRRVSVRIAITGITTKTLGSRIKLFCFAV